MQHKVVYSMHFNFCLFYESARYLSFLFGPWLLQSKENHSLFGIIFRILQVGILVFANLDIEV